MNLPYPLQTTQEVRSFLDKSALFRIVENSFYSKINGARVDNKIARAGVYCMAGRFDLSFIRTSDYTSRKGGLTYSLFMINRAGEKPVHAFIKSNNQRDFDSRAIIDPRLGTLVDYLFRAYKSWPSEI
tara:strand:- start:270 stop:653 length:384 start_codon:yes stop_codon:yes gene_type:complete